MHHPTHIPVLLNETTQHLITPDTAVYADCTAGLGGHAAAVTQHIAGRPGATIALNDLDAANLQAAQNRVEASADPPVRVLTSNANFLAFPRFLTEHSIKADTVLADLGFASSQMDDPERGFAIRYEGPLDMRFNTSTGPTAADLVNTRSQEELFGIIRTLGEEPAARRITAAIARAREDAPIRTTTHLADIVTSVLGRPRHGSIHPATRTFQALRIAVNDELASLDAFLEAVARAALATRNNPGRAWLAPAARIAVISFHSLEDRRVKNAFKAWATRGLGTVLTKQPITAAQAELEHNPRARSAKMRIFQLPKSTDPNV